MQRNRQMQARQKPEEVLCLNCYQTGHTRQDPCPNSSLIGCSKCLRREVLTSMCNCKDRDKPNPPQTLRFARGKSGGILIFIDIEIRGKYFEAVINTRAEETLIGNSVFKWLLELGYSSKDQKRITVPIKICGPPVDLKCKIQKYLDYPVEIGTDFIFERGFTFGLFNVFLNSRRSPVANHPKEVNYLYDLVPDGLSLRKYLERKGQLPSNRDNQIAVRESVRGTKRSFSPKPTSRGTKDQTDHESPRKLRRSISPLSQSRSRPHSSESPRKLRRSISPMSKSRSRPHLSVKSQVSKPKQLPDKNRKRKRTTNCSQ